MEKEIKGKYTHLATAFNIERQILIPQSEYDQLKDHEGLLKELQWYKDRNEYLEAKVLKSDKKIERTKELSDYLEEQLGKVRVKLIAKTTSSNIYKSDVDYWKDKWKDQLGIFNKIMTRSLWHRIRNTNHGDLPINKK